MELFASKLAPDAHCDWHLSTHHWQTRNLNAAGFTTTTGNSSNDGISDQKWWFSWYRLHWRSLNTLWFYKWHVQYLKVVDSRYRKKYAHTLYDPTRWHVQYFNPDIAKNTHMHSYIYIYIYIYIYTRTAIHTLTNVRLSGPPNGSVPLNICSYGISSWLARKRNR